MNKTELTEVGSPDSTRKESVITSVEKWAVLGIVVNLVLTVIKFFAGILGNSNAMVADAVHSASDIFASMFVLISLKIAKKPADKKHPYGYYKAEVISTLIVGLMLWVAGFEILKSSFVLATGTIERPPGNIALYAALLSIAVKELMYVFTYRAGSRANSPSTIANALDHRSDAFSSIATFIGISGAKLGFLILDPIAGMVVSVFIFKMGFEVIVYAIKQIMEENIDDKKLDSINREILAIDEVIGAHDIRGRQSGSIFLIDMHIVVDKDITVQKAHSISETVRKRIINNIENVGDVTIHIDHN